MIINEKIASLFGISIHSIEDELVSFYEPQLPSSLFEDVRLFIDQLKEMNLKENIIHFLDDKYQLSYAVLKNDNKHIILGPYLSSDSKYNPKEIIKKKLILSPLQTEFLDSYLTELHTYNNQQIKTLFEMIFNYKEDNNILINEHTSKIEINTNEVEFPDYIEDSYRIEKKLTEFITTGNLLGVENMINLSQGINASHLGKRVLGDPLRNQKNLTLTLNSICVRAAYDGGLSAKMAHKISTRFAIDIENATSLYQVDQLRKRILIDYTQAVKDNSSSNYSLHVQHILDYIDSNILNKLTVSELSEELHISIEHLSRLFKKEVGKNLSVVITEKRVNEAKKMIDNGVHSMTEISNLLHFSSPSHFSKAFKSVTGLSPKQFKKR